MKGTRDRRARVDDVEADTIASLHANRLCLILAGSAIEGDVVRQSREHLGVIEWLNAFHGGAEIELVLDEHEFLGGWEWPQWIDDDRAEHPRAEVHEDRRAAAVIKERSRITRLEGVVHRLSFGD